MAAFSGQRLDGASGAVLYMQQAAARNLHLKLHQGVVTTAKGSRWLLINLEGTAPSRAEEALQVSVNTAQQALDIWAVRGVMARTLSAVAQEHVVWWSDSGKQVCRLWSTSLVDLRVEGHAEVRDQDGNLIPATPEAPPAWHASFRYFRLGQAATDVVDAFRNYYLALESILDSLEPMPVRPDGRPAQREIEWLDRALNRASRLIDFRDYVSDPTVDDPLASVRADVYTGARTRTFHSKGSSSVLLPHEEGTRDDLRLLIGRLRRLYLDLAQTVLGFRFLGGAGLSPAGFAAMTGAVPGERLYASSEPVPPESRADEIPTGATIFAGSVVHELSGDYQAVYSGRVPVSHLQDPVVRQVGALIGTDKVGIYEDLEGALDTAGLAELEVVLAIAGRDPAALGTRYLS